MSHKQSRLDEALRGLAESRRDLVLLDKDAGTWSRHPWQEVCALGDVIAVRVAERAGTRTPVVGLVGEPTLPFIAALPASWAAGGAFTIAPGPVRGAPPQRWARATMDRFEQAGVTSILSHGQHLELLRSCPSELAVDDLVEFDTAGTRGLGAGTGGLAGRPGRGDRPTAVLQSTAGSTGLARTVDIGDSALLANTDGLRLRLDAGSDDVACSWLPLYHDMGLVFLLFSMLNDLEMWLAPTSAFSVSPFRWLRWLSESGATLTAAPNFAYNLLGQYSGRVEAADLGALRVAVNGGELVDCEGFARFAAEMGRFGFAHSACLPAYGMAEATCAVTAAEPGAGLRFDVTETPSSAPVRHAVLGTPIDGMEIRLRPSDRHGRDFGGREVGEVEIRGTSMMSGYLGGEPDLARRWFPTGDLGYLADGGLVVCGRLKEVIHLAGRNVFPTDVERVAATVDGLRAGCVVATEGPAAGGRAGLAVVAEFRGATRVGVARQLVERIAAECGVVAATVELVSPGSLPRTTSGKLRRTEVGRRLRAGEPVTGAAPAPRSSAGTP